MNIIEFPLHIGDFLSGTMHMDAAETGAYVMLLIAHYQAGPQGLPNDDKKLSRIARCSPKQWEKIRPVLEEKFTISDDFWIQKRVVDVLQKVEDKSSVGKANALKRWNGDYATALRRQCDGNANHKPITNIKEKNTKKEKFEDEFENEFWPVTVKKVGKDAALRAYAKARGRASKDEILIPWRAMNPLWQAKRGTSDWKFVPHPSTWLNEGRWQDEVPGSPSSQPIKPKEDIEKKQYFDDLLSGVGG